MNILYISSEVAPFIKTGGLGDVSSALPKELSKTDDVYVDVFLPYYKTIKDNPSINVEFIKSFGVNVSWRVKHVGIFKLKSNNKKLNIYFIDNEYYFYRDNIYGYYDDGERFSYFSFAVLKTIKELNLSPDIIHLNDWQTALIPVLKKALYSGVFDNIKTVFTIHNIEYQGKMPMEFFSDVIGINESFKNVLTYDNCINFMKSAIVTADKITTVSKTYAHEIRHAFFSHGLHDILKENEYKITGIINGINTDLYNPSTDKTIFKNYSKDDISKKSENKICFQKMAGLNISPDIPMLAIISRLVSHKGLELIEYVIGEILSRNLQLVVLGTGDKKYEDMFKFYAYENKDKMSAFITFDSDLAKKLYASSDILLMPSKSEPCGLSQLIAMRYGTVPIVRETGGLFDTVKPLNITTSEGQGFTFKGYNAHDMLGAIDRCTDFFHNREKWNQHIKNIMSYDSSWQKPAKEYLDLYKNLIRES